MKAGKNEHTYAIEVNSILNLICAHIINYSDMIWEFQWSPREFGTHFIFCFDGISTPNHKNLFENQP